MPAQSFTPPRQARGPRDAVAERHRLRVVTATALALVTLGSCMQSESRGRSEEPSAPASTRAIAPRPEPTPSPTPSAVPKRPVAGIRAAARALLQPGMRPRYASLSESGDLLVWWELRGVRDRDMFRCGYPTVVTWAPRQSWTQGVRGGTVRAWLLAEGMRTVTPTSTGFYLSHSACGGREFDDQSPGLVIDGDARLQTARASSAALPPREGRTAVRCTPPVRGSCQLDPATARMLRLPGRVSWQGTWHDETSILWRSTSHISGTWSTDGGASWNQFIDTWDASPLRRGGATFAVSNGVRSTYGELKGGGMREGYKEWSPQDAEPVTALPKSVDGYRWWRAAPDGTLVGIGRSGGVYVSDGWNWQQVVRRDTQNCRGLDIVGRHLVCGPTLTQGPSRRLRMRVSLDWGGTWSSILLDEVVPSVRKR